MPCAERGSHTYPDLPTAALRVASALIPRGSTAAVPTGEINYLNVFRAIAAKGYTGFLGLEMWPTVAPAQAIRESITLLAEATGGPR